LPSFPRAPEWPVLIRQAKPAVVAITAKDLKGRVLTTGTGFIASREGWVVTTRHLIDDASRVEVHIAHRGTLAARRIVAEDVEADVAVLQLRTTAGIFRCCGWRRKIPRTPARGSP